MRVLGSIASFVMSVPPGLAIHRWRQLIGEAWLISEGRTSSRLFPKGPSLKWIAIVDHRRCMPELNGEKVVRCSASCSFDVILHTQVET